MDIYEMKSALYEYYKYDVDTLTSHISEIVYDITECGYTLSDKLRENLFNTDSRAVWHDVLYWAWEFEYNWIFGQPEDPTIYDRENGYFGPHRPDDRDYLLEIDTFAPKKWMEEYPEAKDTQYGIENHD